MNDAKKDTFRIAKVNSKIEHELGEILHEFLQGENGLVTVSRVETSKDMKWAKVHVSILGGNDDKILKILNENIYEIQGLLNQKFTTKIIPRISFYLDTTPRYVERIEEVIREMHKEDQS